MIVIFARFRSLVALLAAALVLVAAPLARADYGDPPEVEAQRLVHVLGYVGADYGGAVEKGAITNQAEYDEQLSLLDDGAKIAGRIQPALPAGAPRVDLPALVGKVRKLVDEKAPASEVSAATLEAKTAILGSFRLAEAPTTAPNAERGRSLFLQHCTECHGAEGRGDTPKAATLNPRPANFWDPDIADGMTPFRVMNTVRFGVQGTAMVPFSQLSDADRWDLAFYVVSLRHVAEPADGSPTYALAELATRADASLREELEAAGVAKERVPAVLADLRKRAPYEDRAASSPLALARAKLDRARVALQRGDREGAKGQIIDSYLEGVEPVEAQLKSIDAAIVARLEERYMDMRAALDRGEGPADVGASIGQTLAELTAAESKLKEGAKRTGFLSTAISSGGIVVREGVEAALLIAALLGLAAQAGHSDKKRYVHLGWFVAIVLGVLTFLLSQKLITISGANRELIEGITALLATAVLFYVSYSLLAKREVQRWMRFLKEHISPRKAALSLFGVSLLAAYREAFETVLFYQALLASDASPFAAVVGAGVGAVLLVILVVAYTRAGRFAPPQVFFRISSYMLYGLAVVFVGQGLSALQMAGVVPAHRVGLPSVPVLGFYPTLETITAQLVLIALAVGAYVWNKRSPEAGPPTRTATPAAAKG
ncbi:FTR1 family protein [Polyangium spumosum]|uniref:C-type cytochrome n=1 Tax=Polyangium spumosum TaxID=889282 RepID=A0A6N7PZX6_9BACT|nr:FTR1 family protein [Polyangium spumosum]MRG96040.1 c-type cytochrome [Polyangium spumosum]